MTVGNVFTARQLVVLPLLTLIIALNGCGGGSSDSPPGDNSDPPDGNNGGNGGNGVVNESVVDVLDSFGIDTTSSPRLDDGGSNLPDDYSPLGSNTSVGRFEELMLFGVALDSDAGLAGITGGQTPVIDFDLDGTAVVPQLLADPTTSSYPWVTAAGIRGATVSDINSDGLDELIVVWQGEADSPVNVSVVQNLATSPVLNDPLVIATGTELKNVFLTSADLDGDGSLDIAVAMQDVTDFIDVSVLSNSSGVLAVSGAGFSIPASEVSGYVHVAITAGNVDRDDANELALVVNRYSGDISTQTGSDISESTSSWFLLDDAKRNLAQVAGGQSVINTAAGPRVAQVADISLGDVDQDGVDEVVLAGLDNIGRTNNRSFSYLVEVFDDARSDFASITGISASSDLPRQGGSGQSQYMHYLFVRTVDIDGDGADEIVTNQKIWDDLLAGSGELTPLVDQIASAQNESVTNAEIDNAALFGIDQRAYYFSPVHVSFDTGDVNGDEREDIAFWVQRQTSSDRPQELVAYGLSMDRGFVEYASIETVFQNPQRPWRASLLLGDYELNGDTAALRLADGSYRYDLTEPVVLAVLVAAPCAESLGQDLSSCRTGIGNSRTEGGNDTTGWSVFVNGQVGWDARDPITQSGGAILANVGVEVRNYETTAYRTTISVLRETGPIEDTVIFTSIPYDVWSYEVLSHPDPSLIGRTVEVRLPRQPIDIMTTVEIYNSNTAPDAFKVDESVISHTPGDPSTYPTVAERNSLLQRFKGIMTDSQTVGLNTGRQTVTIEQFTETTDGQAYTEMASVEVATVAGGFTTQVEIGGSRESDIASVKGEGTIYLGQVAEIGPDNPISASYDFGLFAYIYEPPGDSAPFEVINYWVEGF